MASYLSWVLGLAYGAGTPATPASQFRPALLAEYPGEVRGGALRNEEFLGWGDSLISVQLQDGRATVLDPKPRFPFAGAGCAYELAGEAGLVVAESGPERALVWLDAGHRRHVIDTGIDTPDVLPAVIHGRPGLLIVNKYMQIRFYEPGADPRRPWLSRDIYSIYTPSRQAGLLMADVDGDGRADIFCGNYWARCPERFELPWRLFAIEPWNETPDSASLRVALLRNGLFASQGEMAREGRIAWFEKPDDPRQLWIEHRLDKGLGLRSPRALVVVGDAVVIGEDAGPGSRLFVWRAGPAGAGSVEQFGTGPGFRFALAAGAGFLTAGAGRITYWRHADRRRPLESSPAGPERRRR